MHCDILGYSVIMPLKRNLDIFQPKLFDKEASDYFLTSKASTVLENSSCKFAFRDPK